MSWSYADLERATASDNGLNAALAILLSNGMAEKSGARLTSLHPRFHVGDMRCHQRQVGLTQT